MSFLVCLKQLIQEYNLCQQLHHLELALPTGGAMQYHTIELTSSLSSCYDKDLWLYSSKFNFRLEGGVLKFLYHTRISQSVSAKSHS